MGNEKRRSLATTEPLTVVRSRLPEIIDEVVSAGSEKVISRHGRQVAVILGYDEYESLIESLNILSDPATMRAEADADAAIEAGDLVEFE